MIAPDQIVAGWRKSTYSESAECVEIAVATGLQDQYEGRGTTFLIRDSKSPEAGALRLTSQQWSTLIRKIKNQLL